MTILHDHQGLGIRLTDERLGHILEHPEMSALAAGIAETLSKPMQVVQSRTDRQVRLYYQQCRGTAVGDKLLCVVVKVTPTDAFVITAYLTDQIKKGAILWKPEP